MNMNLKRMGALAAVILLIGFAAAAMIFAFIDAPWAEQALAASLFCAIVIPVFLYLMMLVAKVLRGRGADQNEKNNSDSPEKKHRP